MSFRIGYVNVQGLSSGVWKAACSLLDSSLDYLFLAETWYVDHKIYSTDRRMIASTKPSSQNRLGRLSGGMYLLGTSEARGRIRDYVVLSDHAITFSAGKQRVSGVYFAPSMSVSDLEQALASIKSSDIVLGDVNTRFRDPSYQAGQPGPPKRLVAFSPFLQPGSFTHLKPDTTTSTFNGASLDTRLTVDHCFTRKLSSSIRLRLLNNKSLQIHTDHCYTLHLTFNSSPPKASTAPKIPRYRISRLSQPKFAQDVVVRFELLFAADSSLPLIRDVDQLNARLVGIC